MQSSNTLRNEFEMIYIPEQLFNVNSGEGVVLYIVM